MGGAPRPGDGRRRTARPDPIAIPREALCEHLADLDEAYDALGPASDPRARRLLDGVLCALHARVFDHLPTGEGPPGAAA
ncbi:MAG: hypothetical protein KDB35_08050 [Acidimicrobiales bacterium]|nr:hypothetical protein [Acidimicrobiales bacterium]MCB1014708.1 hypothetical protein [Acidimicrobiales bacterium]